jgi:alpha-glucoside transport system substrate-binding protein
VLPNPGFMQQLAAQGKLIPLDSFLDMNQIKQDYSQGWLDLGTYNGHLYALFYKAANKGTIWYNPKAFTAGGYQAPSTWSDLITLSDKIAQGGKYPWSMGLSSAAASGWPAADWIAQIYLSQNGGAMYDKWVAHQIPWTDPSICTISVISPKALSPVSSRARYRAPISISSPSQASTRSTRERSPEARMLS